MISRSLRLFVVIVVLSIGACTPGTSEPLCGGTTLRVRTKGVLTVAADLAYPPFAYDRPNDEPAGFDADMLRAVAAQLDVRVLLVNRSPAAAVPGLIAHRHDVIAGGLRETEELRKQACTSISYMDADLGALVPVSSTGDELAVEDFAGRRIGVAEGGRADDYAGDELGDSRIVRLPTDDDVVDAVRGAEVDAGIMELPVARYVAKKSKQVAVGRTIDTGESYVLAVAPDNQPLVDKLNAAIERLSSSGRLAKIERKWFNG